jgi:hypothetical protein
VKAAWRRPLRTKKTDVAERPQASNHVGLLLNEPPGRPGCSLISHPTTSTPMFSGSEFKIAFAAPTARFYRGAPRQNKQPTECSPPPRAALRPSLRQSR